MPDPKIHTSKEIYFVDNLYTSNGFPTSSKHRLETANLVSL